MVKVTPHPAWVADLDAALEPLQKDILDLPVVVDASVNQQDEKGIHAFCLEFYPIIRDFPTWLEVLLKRSPPEGHAFFRDNIRVERRHDAMWRAMGDGFGVRKEEFQAFDMRDSNEAVRRFHQYLSTIGCEGAFAPAVSATNYAVEGVAQKIAHKALEGLKYNERLGERGRWWLEEHAKYDDEHPILALELIKSCVAKGDGEPTEVASAGVRSLHLMREAMHASYRR